MNKIKVSAVSYTNSKPFVYGLMHSGILDSIDLSLDIPSDCANKLIDNAIVFPNGRRTLVVKQVQQLIHLRAVCVLRKIGIAADVGKKDSG